MITKRLKMPLFSANIELVIADFDQKLAEHLGYADPTESMGSPHAAVYNWEANDGSSQMIYIVFNKKWEGNITLGAIAHEASHAIYYAFERKGIDIHPNGETFCYSLEWLVDKTHKFLKKNKFKLC